MAFTQFRWYRRFLPVCDAWIIVAEDLDTGVIWFPIRPVCQILNVDSPSQIVRIKGNWRLAPALHKIPIPFEQRSDGTWANAQQTQSLPSDEFAWWLGEVDPREATALFREKLLLRSRALMALARELYEQRDEEVSGVLQRVTSARKQSSPKGTSVTGEIRTQCPACGAPLCLVIEGAHLVAGVEVE